MNLSKNDLDCFPNIIQETYSCIFCNEQFKWKSSLSKHQNGRCLKMKCISEQSQELCPLVLNIEARYEKEIKDLQKNHEKEITELKCKFEELSQRLTESVETLSKNTIQSGHDNTIQNKITTNSNNKITNSGNVTINLVAYGKEDTSFITEKQFKKIFGSGFESIINFTNLLHFNKKHPECHNVYVNNYQNKKILVYDGEKWISFDKADFLDEYYYDNGGFLIEKYETFKSKLTQDAQRKFEKFIAEHSDIKIEQHLKQELNDLMYNSREIPKKTKSKSKV